MVGNFSQSHVARTRSQKPRSALFSFFLNFIKFFGVTLVNKIIWISSV